MILIKRVASYNFAVMFASLSFFIAGYLIYSSRSAEAATQSYTETYTVTKWMNCSYRGLGQKFSIGPAEWAVSGRIGTTNFSETWTASNWSRVNLSSSEFPCSAESSLGTVPTHSSYPSGLYGITFTANSHGVSTGGLNVPGKWTITGSITTP